MRKRQILDDIKVLIRAAEGLLETLLLTAVFYACWQIFAKAAAQNGSLATTDIKLLLLVYCAILLVVFTLCDGFQYGHMMLTDMVISQWISAAIVNSLMYLVVSLLAGKLFSLLPLLVQQLMSMAVTFACSTLYTMIYHRIYVPHDLLLIYGNKNALDLKFKMDTRRDKYTITEIISDLSDKERIYEAIGRHDAVVINDVSGSKRNDILKYCYGQGVRTYVVPKITDIILTSAQEITLFDTPLKLVRGRGISLPQRFVKRLMDVVLCLIALVPAAPVMLGIAVAIKLEDGGPVFYRQKRITRDGKVFDMLKFRSMVVDAEKGGYNLNLRAKGKDPRITQVGSVIRALRMDELPQLFNILKSEMSIVGPRPERVENVREYSKEIPEWNYRNKVKAGLTGYAQIYGKYNTNPYDKLRLDLAYIENYSLHLDVKLIFMTVRVLFKKESTEGFEKREEMESHRDAIISKLTCAYPEDTAIDCHGKI